MELARYVVLGSGAVAFLGWVMQWLKARRGRSESGRVVNPSSRTGMLLELTALALLFVWRHDALPGWAYAAAGALAVVSAAFGVSAGRHLGRHFRTQAVVTSEHSLVRSGPYSVVRHPIYASLLGLFVAAGIVISNVAGLAIALAVFVAGTEIRVRAEDELLAARFGSEFEEYRRRVRAYVPGLR